MLGPIRSIVNESQDRFNVFLIVQSKKPKLNTMEEQVQPVELSGSPARKAAKAAEPGESAAPPGSPVAQREPRAASDPIKTQMLLSPGIRSATEILTGLAQYVLDVGGQDGLVDIDGEGAGLNSFETGVVRVVVFFFFSLFPSFFFFLLLLSPHFFGSRKKCNASNVSR